MRRKTITGLIAAVAMGTVALVATAQQSGRAPFWPSTTGVPVFSEWYSDIPWHQKLGTFAGNQIIAPLVLPYAALGDNEKKFCTTNSYSPQKCMLELGINNVLGILRTDTPYSPSDPKIRTAQECKDLSTPCIEVKLEVSSFWSRGAGSTVALVARPFGKEPQGDPVGNYGGYVITDGSTYGPQMPWYMSHYCDSLFVKDNQDPVCYADYFSPMNVGLNAVPDQAYDKWPRAVPWSVWPSAPPPAPSNHCPPGLTKCTMAVAGFQLAEVPKNLLDPSVQPKPQFQKYNEFLVTWFSNALKAFPGDLSEAERQRHFPWNGAPWGESAAKDVWTNFVFPRAKLNPFLGTYGTTTPAPAVPTGCDTTLNGPTLSNCDNSGLTRASFYVYPRQCTLGDLAKAVDGIGADVSNLRNCGLNFEIHHNGWLSQWPESYWAKVTAAEMAPANQYGRTSFVFAGVPGMQMPVSFFKDPGSDLTVYERVYNASIFTLYLPITNISDVKRAMGSRNYEDKEFYHTLLMGNHMESDPKQFAEGVRGKVLWHNEYRTQQQYANQGFNPTEWFAAAFKTENAKAPFHNNTCDGCHVRNGSGIPINTAGNLDKSLQKFMLGDAYNPSAGSNDFTFTGQIRPMKLVFFDLNRDLSRADSSRFSEPLSFPAKLLASPPREAQANDLYYSNKVMNFYGDSFHVTQAGYSYDWSYEELAEDSNRKVVKTDRINKELKETYVPRKPKLGTFVTGASCQLAPPPRSPTPPWWPGKCEEVNGAAIREATDGGVVGYMLLNGKRLGNLSAMEAIPSEAILGFLANQRALLGDEIAGEIIWNAGSRDGVKGKVQKNCRTNSTTDCYIGRFGWIGDRVSLEDQVANAAFVEMNLTTREGYETLYPNKNEKVMFPIRYAHPNCGSANKSCVESSGNGDLTERDVKRMADYARWLGNPNRSEFQVSLPDVIAGENVFRQTKCDTCHVINKIDIVPEDTMLSKDFRARLATRVLNKKSGPFLSYIGTDLMMHDMGYLSQVGDTSQTIRRDSDGVVLPKFRNYVQKIRTPALKGLRFNRYVTDSHKNTKGAGDPACDFLLHDGRACDAIEAAFLHDGPAIKKLGVIDGPNGLNSLDSEKLRQLRAFLYSL